MIELLKNVAVYSSDRINISELDIETYVSTENILQNKLGKTVATKLPISTNFVTKYSSGDILIGNIRPYLKKIWFADNEGGSSADVLTIKVKPNSVPRFIYYALLRDDFFDYVMAGSKGTKMPRGDKNQVMNFKIPKFNLDIQSQIAKVLSDLDAKIELNNKINAELEAMAKLIYDYWFVQFEFPNEDGKPYKSSGGKMVWNEELKREVPEGWEVGTLDKIADLIRGVSYGKDDIKSKDESNTIPILRATNISGNKIDLNQMVYVPTEFISENQILNKFDILITMSSGSIDHIGKNGFFYFDKKVAFGAFCAKLVSKKDFRYYLYSYAQSDFMFQTIKNECLGTNINNLNGGIVKSFKIVIPNDKKIQLFNKKVDSLYEKIALNTIENKKLAELRDWLLPMLMNGQVKVSEL